MQACENGNSRQPEMPNTLEKSGRLAAEKEILAASALAIDTQQLLTFQFKELLPRSLYMHLFGLFLFFAKNVSW